MGSRGQGGTHEQMPGQGKLSLWAQVPQEKTPGPWVQRLPTGIHADPHWNQLEWCTQHTRKSLSPETGGGSIRRVGVDTQLKNKGFGGTWTYSTCIILSERTAYSLVIQQSCEMPPTYHVNISDIMLSQKRTKKKKRCLPFRLLILFLYHQFYSTEKKFVMTSLSLFLLDISKCDPNIQAKSPINSSLYPSRFPLLGSFYNTWAGGQVLWGNLWWGSGFP